VTLTLTQSATAIGPGRYVSFGASGGTSPYTYAVLPGGAGGTINSATGDYTGPAAVPASAATQYDTIQVTDAAAATATAKVMIGDALLLFCDIVETGMGLSPGRVYIWDQKIFMPSDAGLYVVVAESEPKPIGNINEPASSGTQQNQFVTWKSRLEVNLISRDNSARLQKSAFLMALNSTYATQQMEANSFYVAKTPVAFRNMSISDGAAIPYRYAVHLAIQYSEAAVSAEPYISSFSTPVITVNA
jgi:hypothetical protein